MRPRLTEPPPRQPRESRRYASLSAEGSGRDHDADPRDHDADLADQSADPGDHAAPIRAITMRRSSRSRWRVTRRHSVALGSSPGASAAGRPAPRTAVRLVEATRSGRLFPLREPCLASVCGGPNGIEASWDAARVGAATFFAREPRERALPAPRTRRRATRPMVGQGRDLGPRMRGRHRAVAPMSRS